MRVTDVRRRKTGDGAELLVSLRLTREGASEAPSSRPRAVRDRRGAIRGDRRDGRADESELKDHRIPLDEAHDRGWGRVSIPADANPADNDFWFVFEQPAPRDGRRRGRGSARPPGRSSLPRRSRPTRRLQVLGRGDRRRATGARRLGQGRPAVLAGPAARRRRGEAGSQAFVDRGGLGDLLSAPGPGHGRVLRRALDVVDRTEATETSPSRAGGATRTCSPARRAGRRCRSGSLQVRRYCGLSAASSTPLATLTGGAPLLARVDDRTEAAPTSARPRRRRATRRWRPAASSFMCLVQRAPGGRAAIWETRGSSMAGDPPRGRSVGLEAAGRRPRRRCRPNTRFTAASIQSGDRLLGREPIGRRGVGSRPGRRRAWPGCSTDSISPASTTRRAVSAR